MTTTAHEDQYTVAPEPVRQPYDTVAILRRNVADLELALRTQTERAESAEAELAQARKQKPVAYVKYKATGGNVGLSWLAVPTGEFYPREGEPLYVNPVPAPAVPELDPMTRLIVSDPKQLKPKKQEPAVPRKYHEFASVMLDAQPFITAETYGGRYIVAMRFERLGKMQDCHAALLALLQSDEVRHD